MLIVFYRYDNVCLAENNGVKSVHVATHAGDVMVQLVDHRDAVSHRCQRR